MALEKLCKNLRFKRLSSGITLKEVSIATGVDIGQLSRIERGQCRYKSKNLTKYCKYLGISHDDATQSADLLLTRIDALIRQSPQHAELFSKLVLVMESLPEQNQSFETDN
jgi:transcriptional regulator with XRE-family HTH domain